MRQYRYSIKDLVEKWSHALATEEVKRLVKQARRPAK